MKMLDLFSGLGGASQAMIDRDWDVVRIDNNNKFKPTIVADLNDYIPSGEFDFIWASPPCTDFARWAMPESFGPRRIPSLSLVKHTIEIINSLNPAWWIIENVRGARQWFEPLLGKPTHVIGPYTFWGKHPPLKKLSRIEYCGKGKWKLPPSPMRPALRSKIPYAISSMVTEVLERANG